jgi:plastocyanin
MAAVFKELAPPMVVFAIVGLAAAGAVLAGWRWAPALSSVYALLLGALLVAPAASEIAHALGQPSDGMYPLLVIFFPTMGITIVSGIAATVQNYRQGAFERTTPRWLTPGVATMAGIAAGALVIGAFPRPSAADSVSAEVLASLPAVRAQTFQFQQTELRVKAGETVAFRLENGDVAGHYFEIDELGVHAPIPAGQSSFTLFKPSQPGTYTFYCAPHYDKASGQGMKGTLIVE